MTIDEYKFYMYVFTDAWALAKTLEPLFVVADIMKGVLGIKNPITHPFYVKHKSNGYLFTSFKLDQLPSELVQRIQSGELELDNEYLYLFTE